MNSTGLTIYTIFPRRRLATNHMAANSLNAYNLKKIFVCFSQVIKVLAKFSKLCKFYGGAVDR